MAATYIAPAVEADPVASAAVAALAANSWLVGATRPFRSVTAAPYNADPTGVVDAAAGVTQAITDGGTVWVAAGTYKMLSGLVATSGNFELVMAAGAVLDFSTAPSSAVLITVEGSAEASVPLTADTAVNGSGVSVAAAAEAGFTAGNIVQLGSNEYYEIRSAVYGASTGQKIGEMCSVLSTASGSVTMRSRLVGGHLDDADAPRLTYKTADAAFIRKMNLVENVTIRGGTIRGIPSGGSQVGVLFKKARNCWVEGTRFIDVASLSVNFHESMHCGARGVYCENAYASTGYGIAASAGSQDITFTDCHMHKCRHAFTCGGGQDTYGPVRRVDVVNCHSFNSHPTTGDAFDTHAGGEDITFHLCSTTGSGGLGFNLEVSSGRVTECTVDRCAQIGIAWTNHTRAPGSFDISRNKLRHCGTAAINVGVATIAGVGTEFESLTVTGNRSYASGNKDISVVGSSTRPLSGALIEGNTIDRPGTSIAPILIEYCPSGSVCGNTLTRVPPTFWGIKVANSAKMSVVGNTVHYNSVGTGVAFRIGPSITDSVVTGNTASLAGNGVFLENTSTGNLVSDNHVSGCTTPITPGTGTNNRFEDNHRGVPKVAVVATDANFTLTVNGSSEEIVHTGTLTANRTITLSTASVYTGARFRVTRSGGGAFTLSVGGLKLLSTGQWADVVYDGAAWVLAASGSL